MSDMPTDNSRKPKRSRKPKSEKPAIPDVTAVETSATTVEGDESTSGGGAQEAPKEVPPIPEPVEPAVAAPSQKAAVSEARPLAVNVLRVAGFLVLAFIVYWVLDKVFVYKTSSSYVDEIAQVYDLNPHLAKALTIIGFAFLAIAGELAFSFSRIKRYAAWSAILVALVGHSLVLWQGTRSQFFSRSGEAIKCYIITRTAITYGERPGIDPATGRECRLITPEIVERIKEYESGRRPGLISSANPVFFDPRTGAPVVWFGTGQSGTVEIFDLMGFHPQTGAELLPITHEAIARWQKQQRDVQEAQLKRVPNRIDPEKFGFFDPINGRPRVWYWRSEQGEYEFYDADGFHKKSGEPLTIVSPSFVTQWKREQAEALRKKAELEEQRLQEERERAERAERERQAAIIQRQQSEALERAQAERERNAGTACDQLAANPTDRRKPSHIAGTPYEVLKAGTAEAISACQTAVRVFPGEPRYAYQLARAVQIKSPQEAMSMLQPLVTARYPAAYDNLGWLHIRLYKDYSEAVRLFKLGAQMDDPDCIVSLAELVDKGYYQPTSAAEGKWQLFARAASLGHVNAGLAIERERARIESEMAQQQQQDDAARAIFEVLGGVIRTIPRR